MGVFVGLHNQVYVGHLDLTDHTREVMFGPLTRAMQDSTTFSDAGYTCVKPGLISGEASVKGFADFDADQINEELGIDQLGSQYPVTVLPNETGTVTAGDPAWLSRGLVGTLNPLAGAKGEMAGHELTLPYDAAIAQAKVLHAKAARTTDTNGTAVAMTGPTAAQKLYATLHVVAYSGLTNAVITVESDDSGAFSSPTTRITFTTVTGLTSQFASVAGSFASESHLRAVVDVTGTGSVTFLVAAGVI